VGASSAASVAGVEVGGVGVCCEDHAAGAVEDAVVGIGGAVVEEMIEAGVGGCCGCSLLCAKFAEGMEKFVVHCSCVVKECTHNALNAFDAKGIKGWGSVGVGGVLDFGTISDGSSLVRREDWSLGFLVVIFGEHGVDVVFHGEATGAFGVVPGEVDAGVKVTFPVFSEVIGLLYGVSEVVSVVVADVFDSEVVDYECEHDGLPLVAPEARSAFTLVVAFVGEMLSEEVLGEDAGLGEAVDAFANFEVYPAVVYVMQEVVLSDEFLWDVREFDFDVLGSVEGGAEIEVERMLLIMSLTSSRGAVLVPTSPG